MALHNLARVTSATTGTGTLTLGSAVSGFLTFGDAGVVDAEQVVYSIRDGANSEIGIGTYTASGTTLSRDTVYESTNSGNKINCSGSQEVFITAAAENINRQYILLHDEKTQNTSGGDFTSGDWRTRVLNTEVYDVGGNASLSSNQITLAAGTYEFEISCPAHHVSRHQARLYNVTDGAAVAYGTSEFQNAATTTSATRSFIKGRFTIAASKVLEVQHRCETTFSTYGFGVEANFGTEVYTVAEFWKVPF
jgi:hypothetical protein